MILITTTYAWVFVSMFFFIISPYQISPNVPPLSDVHKSYNIYGSLTWLFVSSLPFVYNPFNHLPIIKFLYVSSPENASTKLC